MTTENKQIFTKEKIKKIAKSLEKLDFITNFDAGNYTLYNDPDELEEGEVLDDFEELEFNEILTDDRFEVMQDDFIKRVKVILLKDKDLKSIKELNVSVDRLDAYPSGHALYSMMIYYSNT
jgi:hypothetical protein